MLISSIGLSLLALLGLIVTNNMKPEFSALPLGINLDLIIIIESISLMLARKLTKA